MTEQSELDRSFFDSLVVDPNVDVIYVSPVPINDECMQYYAKLLALKPAVDSGNVDNQNDLSDRYKIVIPEAIKSFPVSIAKNANGSCTCAQFIIQKLQ